MFYIITFHIRRNYIYNFLNYQIKTAYISSGNSLRGRGGGGVFFSLPLPSRRVFLAIPFLCTHFSSQIMRTIYKIMDREGGDFARGSAGLLLFRICGDLFPQKRELAYTFFYYENTTQTV